MTAVDEAWTAISTWAGAGLVIAALTVWIGGRFLTIRLRPLRAAVAFVAGGLLGYVLLGIFVVRDEWHWHYGVIFLAFTAFSVLLAIPGGPAILPGLELYDVLGFGVLFAGSILLLRVLTSFARTRDET